MSDLSKLSAARIEALYEKRFAADSDVTKRCIAAGMHDWRPGDRDAALRGDRAASDEQIAIAAEWKASADAFFAVADEMEQRKRWHGSLKPIKRGAA